MKQKFTILTLLVIVTLVGCDGSTSDKAKELELKEKELVLKEKELKLKERERNADEKENAGKEKAKKKSQAEEITKPARNNDLSNIENLIGNWFKPKEASITLKFTRDGRFVFNDFNSSKNASELLTGKFTLKNGTLRLMYDDRPKQDFKFYKEEGEYYIRKGTYYFVKGDN